MANIDLLIDGDLLLYKTACGVEKEVRWDDENHVLYSNREDGWGALTDWLKRLQDKFEPENTVIALTGKGNFRKDLFPLYKGNRADNRKPLCYADLAERLKDNYHVVLYDRLEADDVLGILATKPSPNKRIIVSDDKDMASIPSTVYAKGEVTTYTEEQADYNHMFQTLTGDQADNYPGCPGIGPVKAKKLLESKDGDTMTFNNMWGRVKLAYSKAGLNEEDALLQARLARILRWSDWDSDKKEPILWTPTQ